MTSTPNDSAAQAIMVLDDGTDIVYILKRSLELARYDVFAFTDPILALEHLKNSHDRYGMIISDVRMPKMNGIKFAAEVRKISSKLTIVLMSVFSMADLEIPPELKIAELLEKPATPTRLKAMVPKYIKIADSTSA